METILQRRKRLLGTRVPQYYDTPFHPVSGMGVWVKDVTGRTFLDAYNNVPHVGHCHPHVVEAICRQTRTLNTNTRYIFESILDYAERLIATMPPELNVCAFTCTGSEANDLAWRMARCFTEAEGALTTTHAYHGNTTFLDSIDGTSVRSRRPAAAWWATIPAPSSTPYPTVCAQQAVERLVDNGYKPAALFIDSTFASDGLLMPEPGCLGAAIEVVRNAGGLVIADEVQAGLGRLGTDLWSWQRLGLAPDFVTMGKPMANGEPLGIVVTRREILEKFQAEDRYFNTFAGNPVACGAGLAVLDVVENEKLQANAASVGRLLADSIRELAKRHEYIRGVRGIGFLLGVEIAKHGHPEEPGPQETRWILNDMLRRGVLVGLTGPRRHAMDTLKVRPPMVFTSANVDRFVTTLDQSLTALAAAGGAKD
jgi:4-aminobutyrate aminotransferase-like enzyme